MNQHDVAVKTVGIRPFIFPDSVENFLAAEVMLHIGSRVVTVGESSGGVVDDLQPKLPDPGGYCRIVMLVGRNEIRCVSDAELTQQLIALEYVLVEFLFGHQQGIPLVPWGI